MKKTMVVVFSLFLVCISAFCMLGPDQEISVSERRPLKQFPDLSLNSVISGRFMDEFESYAADQFPFREKWRSLKAGIVKNVFQQSDNNDLFEKNGHLVKIEYPYNESSVMRAASIFRSIYERQLEKNSCNVYFSVIPDKNYYLGENHLQMDYEALETLMKEELSMMQYVDIFNLLNAEDYYHTDSHWKQEKILDVAQCLLETMGNEISEGYQEYVLETPFYGVYYGQAALDVEPDEIRYLTNEQLEACEVYDYQNQKEISIYDMEKAKSNDPYEMFLSGPISLIEITNPNADTDKELIVYRDSFGSSIAPLLVESYAKVTLVDIRYIASSYVETMLDYEDADVLFLYSSSVLNHSETIK